MARTNTFDILLELALALPEESRTFAAGRFKLHTSAPGSPCGCLLGTLAVGVESGVSNDASCISRYGLDDAFHDWVDGLGLNLEQLRLAECTNDRYQGGVPYAVQVARDRYAHVVGALAGYAFRLREDPTWSHS